MRRLAKRGVLVRHLVMPDGLDETGEIMRFLEGEVSADTYVNIMDQYYSTAKVMLTGKYEEINLGITQDEFDEAYRVARKVGLHRFGERSARPLFARRLAP